MKKCLITGIGGFVGPYLKSHLESKGLQVYGLERKASVQENVFQCNILDRKRVFQLIEKIKPDYIFHLAGQSSVKKSWDQPKETFEINVEGTRNIIDGIISARISPRILIVSSSEVYGTPKKLPITEEHVLNPESPYAKSRVEQEKLCLNYDLDIIITRSFNHIGPGQSEVFVCSDFAKQIAEIERGKREPIIYVGNLCAERDFSDVRDIVRAYLMAVEKGASKKVYNLCSNKPYSIKEILDILCNLSKVELVIKTDSKKLRVMDVPILTGSYQKFYQETGWKPDIKIQETLRKILDYWRKEVH